VASLTDRTVLVGQAYANAGPLEARRAIYRWQQPPRELPGAALSFLQDVTGLVVDVGCGPRQYLSRIASERPDLSVLGLDLSPGMRPHAVADAQQLPLADHVAGAVLAMHMLYHVPDIDRAIGELARVLRRNGIAIVATNGEGHMRQFRELFAAAVRMADPAATAGGLVSGSVRTAGPAAMTGSPVPGPGVSHRFRLENAPAMLRRHFASAEVVCWQTKIEIPETGPVVAYLDSQRASRADQLPAEVTWAAMLDAARTVTDEIIARDGAFTADSHSGLIVCRNSGHS
jgi:SAM-dependent methyltransferase